MFHADIEISFDRNYIRVVVPVGENRLCMTEPICLRWEIIA